MEITCPRECRYLRTSRTHPASIVRKQHDRDLAFAAGVLRTLSRPQEELCWELLGVVARFAGDPLLRLEDADVIDAVSALASTVETSAKGVIYEHRPNSLVAQRLVSDVRAWLEEAAKAGARIPDSDLAVVLRRLSEGFKEARQAPSSAADPTFCLAALGRLHKAIVDSGRGQAAGLRLASPGPALIRP